MLVLFILSIALIFMLTFIASGIYIAYVVFKTPTLPTEEDTPEKDTRELLKG
jgi:hypothetical protein